MKKNTLLALLATAVILPACETREAVRTRKEAISRAQEEILSRRNKHIPPQDDGQMWLPNDQWLEF